MEKCTSKVKSDEPETAAKSSYNSHCNTSKQL